MSFAAYIKQHPSLKRLALRTLMPAGEARPRWWVRNLLNPFLMKKGKGAKIRRRTRMDIMPFNNFRLGAHSMVEDFACVNNGMGDVLIGDHSLIGIGCVIIGPVEIGNNVILAQHIGVSGLNHGYKDISIPIKNQPCETGLIRIGDDSWIGANAVIVAGVTIGKHCIVAGGSVVTKNVADHTMVGGNPARILKQYNVQTGDWEKPLITR